MLGLLNRLTPYLLAFSSSLCIMVLELVASRLVAQHVGASLSVWTSVIGVILAGICLGNVLGGKLADRIEPRQALGPLFALGAVLTLGALWLNALIGYLPIPVAFPWHVRTLLVVTIDFLIPSTVLGMISPVVAKIAVSQAKRAGSAIGDVYFWGAVGSIVGTYLAGFWLINIAPVSTIVSFVAAGLALLAALLLSTPLDRGIGLGAVVLLGLGALESINGSLALPGLVLGNVKINLLGLLGQLLVALLAFRCMGAFRQSIRMGVGEGADLAVGELSQTERPKLGDLATLAFLASMGFMALEMVAGRLVTRHLGSSLYGWTSVIGILLGGLSLGNFLGGKLADRIKSEKQASTLFMVASALVLYVLMSETPPKWLVRNPIGYLFRGEMADPLAGGPDEFLHQPVFMSGYPWWFRVLWWTGVVFLVPAISMGTVSPIVAKLAVDRTKRSSTGSAIGSVYAWGMVGSLVGTFLTGFLLIDVLGTKGVLLALATMLALSATALGSIWHAAWAGIPLGLCVIAFLPALMPVSAPVANASGAVPPASGLWKMKSFLMDQSVTWGLREKPADPETVDGAVAYVDESNYYFIKVNNERLKDGLKRTLVLDNLIHGYCILGKPEVLDYDYEHIYALVTHRLMQEKAARLGSEEPAKPELGTLFLGGGSYTFPRYLQAIYPRTWAEVAEIDPAVTRANHIALGLPWPESSLPKPVASADGKGESLELGGRTIDLGPAGTEENLKAQVEALGEIAPVYHKEEKTGQAVVVLDGEVKPLGEHGTKASQLAYIDSVRQWYANSKYRIRTTWGDARQYVVQNQGRKQFDVVYGDAFNDFSVPWHLTTYEFNKMLDNMLTPDGVYMINIIDVYESDQHAASAGPYRELQSIIGRHLKTGWVGGRQVDRLARDMAGLLLDHGREPFAAGYWDRLGEDAKRVLGPAEPLTSAQIEQRLGAAYLGGRMMDGPLTLGLGLVGDEQGELNDRLLIKLNMGVVLAKARADEVLATVDEARYNAARRLQNGEVSDATANIVANALSAIRAECIPWSFLGERTVAITTTLKEAISTANSLAEVQQGGLVRAAEETRDRLLKAYESKSATAMNVKTSLDIMEAIKRIEEQLAPQFQGNEEQAERQAILIAGQVLSDLERVERELAGRFSELTKHARGDEALVESAVPDVDRFMHSPGQWVTVAAESITKARQVGGFLGAWVNTARKSFEHVYVFGTASLAGLGDRETFVVVASRKPLDVNELGKRDSDPVFFMGSMRSQPAPYGPADLSAVGLRSRGVVLTDDYAPVENLLAPVADTRGRE